MFKTQKIFPLDHTQRNVVSASLPFSWDQPVPGQVRAARVHLLLPWSLSALGTLSTLVRAGAGRGL